VVPATDENIIVAKGEYDKWRGNSKSKPLLTKYKLHFSAKDIKYLIVERDDEMQIIIDWINKTELIASSELEKLALIRGINSIQQIKDDF
jgi:hypothetical protein